MGTYMATINWQRNEAKFTDNRYSRAHMWQFDGGCSVPASSSPHVVPLPYSDASAVDPEEAFVASLSSCHMLCFLYIAAKRGFVVDSYRDEAQGMMEEHGKQCDQFGQFLIVHGNEISYNSSPKILGDFLGHF